MKNLKKPGVFLSLETMLILVVSIILFGLVFMGAGMLLMNLGISKISNEYNHYKESIVKFNTIYDYWPGDLPKSGLIGEMADSSLIADTDAVIAEAVNDSTTGYADIKYEYEFGSGSVGGLKSGLAFSAMKVAGIIRDDVAAGIPALTASYTVSGSSNVYPSAYDLVQNKNLPISTYDGNLAWAFYVNIANAEPRHGFGYAENDAFRARMNQDWDGAPKLVLFNYSNIPNALYCNGCQYFSNFYGGVFGYSATGSAPLSTMADRTGLPLFPVAAISSKMASSLDLKLDDGRPAGLNSKIFGIDVVTSSANGSEDASSVFGCTDDLRNQLTSSSNWEALNYSEDNSTADGYSGCVMYFKF